jgi:hypothetical protein
MFGGDPTRDVEHAAQITILLWRLQTSSLHVYGSADATLSILNGLRSENSRVSLQEKAATWRMLVPARAVSIPLEGPFSRRVRGAPGRPSRRVSSTLRCHRPAPPLSMWLRGHRHGDGRSVTRAASLRVSASGLRLALPAPLTVAGQGRAARGWRCARLSATVLVTVRKSPARANELEYAKKGGLPVSRTARAGSGTCRNKL